IIPNRPSSLRPGKTNPVIIKERNKWLERFAAGEIFTSAELTDALKEPFLVRRHAMPQEVTQLALRLKKKYPELSQIHSCIEPKTQKTCEQLAQQYMQRQHSKGIFNASIVVMNNTTREIIGYIASPDFKDTEHDGQIDGIQAVRSPGSTLKPLVYAQAFDRGLLTPHSIIADVPTDFNGYTPVNFDQKFYGNVSVEKALSYSLNIPAVKALQLVGQKEFIDLLKKAGFQTIQKKANQLGPSLILGGCGVTLEEITHAFTAFTNKGKLIPYALVKNQKDNRSVQLFSPASAYMIHEILSTISRPDLPNHFQNTYRVPRIAWKTGTSYGRRDAWSIGYSKNYTIGVWIGNFDGKGVPELTGADIATPLLFQLFNTLDYNASGDWFSKPESLSFRYICPESGLLPGETCAHTVLDYFIPNVSTAKKCAHLKTVFISSDEKMSYCGRCLPEFGYIKKNFLNLSPELVSFYQKEQLPFEAIPPHNIYCEYSVNAKPPEIISPVHHKEYLIEKLSPSEILLKSRCASDVKKVYWYINNVFYKEAKNGEAVFFTPEEGTIKISCSDDKGNNSNVEIDAVFY
ncbi:MAG: pbpC, partial [Chitinophagaceae bacterium]|nr:pbpC [Chitinophagaceae bacterium]